MPLSKFLCIVTSTIFICTAPLHAVEPTTFPGPKKNSPPIKKDAVPKQVKTTKAKAPDGVIAPQKESPKKNKTNQ